MCIRLKIANQSNFKFVYDTIDASFNPYADFNKFLVLLLKNLIHKIIKIISKKFNVFKNFKNSNQFYLKPQKLFNP